VDSRTNYAKDISSMLKEVSAPVRFC